MDYPYRPYQNEIDQFQAFPFYNCGTKQVNTTDLYDVFYNMLRSLLTIYTDKI